MAGPYTRVDLGDGQGVDLYLLRYDEDGRLLSPKAHAEIVSSLDEGCSDVFVFSHGWNNNFEVASERYLKFIQGYAEQRRRLGLPTAPGYKPLLVGVIWPSTSFLFPWEKGPKIAASPGVEDAEREEMFRLVMGAMEPEERAQLVEVVDGAESLDQAGASEAAELVLRALWPAADPDDSPGVLPDDERMKAAVADFLTTWGTLDGEEAPAPQGPDDFGPVGGEAGGGVRAAGGSRFDPRSLLRTATVWLMKDRAGKVGSRGVAPLVETVLNHPLKPRLHLVGHSFGARVVLSAMATQGSKRKAHSMLLLQPAVNRWCFAHKVIGTGVPGGYRPVLDRVERPILTTYSRHDKPLHEAFHLAVRGSSLGEPDIAAIGDTDRYGALGGYGPAGIDDLLTKRDALAEGSDYELSGVTGVVAIDGGVALAGKPAIDAHGDISSKVTWWALHSLTGAT